MCVQNPKANASQVLALLQRSATANLLLDVMVSITILHPPYPSDAACALSNHTWDVVWRSLTELPSAKPSDCHLQCL